MAYCRKLLGLRTAYYQFIVESALVLFDNVKER